MFPRPIQQASPAWQTTYHALVPLAFVMWLLPLIAVAVFSVKPDVDFTTGNYWGLPSSFKGIENYGKVFFASDMPRYLWNSVLITVPTVIGSGAKLLLNAGGGSTIRVSVAGPLLPNDVVRSPVVLT